MSINNHVAAMVWYNNTRQQNTVISTSEIKRDYSGLICLLFKKNSMIVVYLLFVPLVSNPTFSKLLAPAEGCHQRKPRLHSLLHHKPAS